MRLTCERLLPIPVGGVSVSALMKSNFISPALLSLALIGLFPVFALAQIIDPDTPNTPPLNPPLESPEPETLEPETPEPETSTPEQTPDELVGVLNTGPDYSALTPKAEREARLDALFARLKTANEEDSELIAEEIWAIWLDSGSPSVDMLLLRGTAFEKRGETERARRMYDHVTTLMPEHAEGWARSARLAYEEEDYSRALVEAAQTLILEPREFYALWTMGNVLEKLGRVDEAFETYKEALEIYPEHPAIKDRVNTLQSQIDGAVL